MDYRPMLFTVVVVIFCSPLSAFKSSGSLYGALIGSVLAFKIADFIGRRGELITSAVLYLVGALITAIGPNFVILMIGRFIYGIGIGLAMPAAPMYISETAPSHLRGRVISLKEFKGFLEKIGDL